MPSSRFLLFVIACLLPASAVAADSVGAAVATRSFDATLRFEDGALVERRFRRAGVEYWEGLTDNVFAGFTVGYSESEGRDAARPFETVSGNYGSLGLRFDAPFNEYVVLRGRVEYLLQRDRQDTGEVEFETRTYETRAELGPVLRYGRLEFGAGASWRDLDYRETIEDATGETVRHADAVDHAGGFATLGFRTNDEGAIALRYDAGAEDGWSLRFERTF